MLVAGLFNQRPAVDTTCYTSPTVHVTYSWPHGLQAYTYAVALFAYIFIAIMVVWMWKHYRPCEGCGEYQDQCRCKQRIY